MASAFCNVCLVVHVLTKKMEVFYAGTGISL